MNQKRCAVFSCLGLGDGLISLVLSNNLHLHGFQVDTFHPHLKGLQEWFPHLPLKLFSEIPPFSHYEKIFIFYEKSPWMQRVLTCCQTHFPEKTHILNPIATLKTTYPYWEVGKFQGDKTFVDNLYLYCRDILKLSHPTRENGIVLPKEVVKMKFPKRVVIHPTSSRPGKNWPKEKFLALAKELTKRGYDPVFIVSPGEKEDWEDVNPLSFPTLSECAFFIAESGFMIGNDSGIGHLASCLGLPTLTICRSRLSAGFWRPGWTKSQILTPSPLIPNIKGFRIRDKYWKKWISVNRVLKTFLNKN